MHGSSGLPDEASESPSMKGWWLDNITWEMIGKLSSLKFIELVFIYLYIDYLLLNIHFGYYLESKTFKFQESKSNIGI